MPDLRQKSYIDSQVVEPFKLLIWDRVWIFFTSNDNVGMSRLLIEHFKEKAKGILWKRTEKEENWKE